MSIVQAELYLSVDKLKKKKQTTRKTAARKRRCLCTDVNVYVMYNLSHVKTERTYILDLDLGVQVDSVKRDSGRF